MLLEAAEPSAKQTKCVGAKMSDPICEMLVQRLTNLEGFVFDLDGTLYVGDALLPGAAATVAELRRRGKRTLFVTNKPVDSRPTYAAKLTKLGIPATEEDVITSAFVLAHYLAHHAPDLRYYVLGEPNFLAELRSHGLTVVEELSDQSELGMITPDGIDAVIVAMDRTDRKST